MLCLCSLNTQYSVLLSEQQEKIAYGRRVMRKFQYLSLYNNSTAPQAVKTPIFKWCISQTLIVSNGESLDCQNEQIASILNSEANNVKTHHLKHASPRAGFSMNERSTKLLKCPNWGLL